MQSPDAILTWIQRYPRLAALVDPTQSDDAFDRIVEGLLEEAVQFLEENANLYGSDHEEKLTSVIDAILRRDGIRVTRENNINGHVDLCIEFDLALPKKRRLGEAKCWKSPRHHADGIAQLLGYMTGREGSGYMINYVKQDAIAKKWASLKEYLDQERPAHQETESRNLAHTWSLETRHTHSSAMSIRIVHFGVNLFRPSKPNLKGQ